MPIGRVGRAEPAGGEVHRAAGRAQQPGVVVAGGIGGERRVGPGAALDGHEKGGRGIVLAGGPQHRADLPRDVGRPPPDRAVEGVPAGAVVEEGAGAGLGEAPCRDLGP